MTATIVALNEEVKPHETCAEDEVNLDFNAADLRTSNLTGCDLSGEELVGANLEGAILREADLTRTNCDGACFDKADLSGADLTGAVLSGASFFEAVIEGGLRITGHNPVVQLGPIGDRYVTAYHTNQGIFFRCGKFFGAASCFLEAVEQQGLLPGLNSAAVIIQMLEYIWKF